MAEVCALLLPPQLLFSQLHTMISALLQAVQHKKVREGRARYLKAKKDKQKQKRSDEWAQQADPGIQDKPGFGEQTLAPPKVCPLQAHLGMPVLHRPDSQAPVCRRR